MTKHRLMLSAAAGALAVSALAVSLAHADTTLSSTDKNAHTTATDGNLTIDSNGAVAVGAGSAAVTLNSNNWVSNQGSISNTDNSNAIGLEIDTSAGNLVTPLSTTGFANLGAISLTGSGTGKAAILVTGGNTFYGPITLSSVTTIVTTGSTSQAVVGGSSVSVQGDSSSAFYLVNGTTIAGDVSVGGTMAMAPSSGSQGSASTLVTFDGLLKGNFVIDNTASLSNLGTGARGVSILGGIQTCDSAAMSAVGLACAANSAGTQTSVGTFVNMGTIAVTGVQYVDTRKVNPESGSALVIGSSIDGGVLNDGPATADSTTVSATLSANGISSAPTVLIDPSQALITGTSTPRGPIIIGPVASVIDSIDPGYSFINRGTITATPLDNGISSMAMAIVGSSPTNFTCLGAYSGGACTGGGLLNTGSIVARSSVASQTNSSVSAIALQIGQYATVPRIVVAGEAETGSSYTSGTIGASVSGAGGGSAAAIVIGQYANVPLIDVRQHGSITAAVSTSTISPTVAEASSTAPFALISEAIVDSSGTVQTINNAGTISALNTQLTPATGAVVVNEARAIDLLSSQLSNVTINNSGVIQGDVLFGTVGNNLVFNVGNTGSGGTAGPTGVLATPNAYAVVAATSTTYISGAAPVTTANTINFGSGTGDALNVGAFGYVNSVILSGQGGLDVNVYNNGTLYIANTETTGPVNAHDFHVYSGSTLGLTISQQTSGSTPVVAASNSATIESGAKLGLQFGSFVSSGTTRESVDNPVAQNIALVTAPLGTLNISDTTLADDNAALAESIPYLFQPTSTPLSKTTIGGKDALVLTLTPKSPSQLGLTGDAAAIFPYAAAALGKDATLGASVATGITSAQTAQNVFSQFTPDVSGGARQVAILITDQATGPVAARQRLLRSFADQPGEMTLWGEEFAANINNKGRVDAAGTLTAYKDHGFGFAVGIDGGSTRDGWYGGAISFYSGDVTQSLPHATKTNTQWYMLTGYTDWRGRKLFLDTQLSVAYGDFTGHRSLIICSGGAVTCSTPALQRTADSKRGALMGALGATTGAVLRWQGLQVIPHISLDAMSLREEGYTENGGGDGLNLQVEPYYANSIRGALGTDLKANVHLWDFVLSPEARLGYRYDFINTPVKLKAAFASTGGTSTAGNEFTFVGPDPDSGNVILGAGLGASSDSWQVGVNYDWVRGNNGSTTQVGMVTVLGRI